MNNDEKIVEEMIDSLVDTNIELWEINFDLLSNFEILKDIPVLRVAYNLCNFGKGIHDFIFIRKLQKFLINLPNVTEKEKEAFFERYKKDEIKFAEKLFEIIDNIDNSDKCEYEGKIFEKYFYNKISYEEFKMFSYALPKIGMDNIKKCYQIKIENNIDEDGQLEIPRKFGGEFLSSGMAGIITYPGECGYSLNENGYKFIECIFE